MDCRLHLARRHPRAQKTNLRSIEDYRERNKIEDEQHRIALLSLGWTLDEFKNGYHLLKEMESIS